MAGAVVKHEFPPSFSPRNTNPTSSVISISSTEISGSSDVFSDEDDDAKSSDKRHSTTSFENSGGPPKKPKVEIADSPVIVMPIRSVDPSSGYNQLQLSAPANGGGIATFHDNDDTRLKRCKHFWKAGDYDGGLAPQSQPTSNGGMDHVRVHPRFLHSNATSHKWALGAFAELLDNSLDEVRTGASYVIVDMLLNEKDDSKMLLVQDNGGGMNPDKMRQCMSLGYSAKSKLADTIGQYGNGFKTSTMRLGADVIVFSCCQGKDGSCPTKSIGLLSYTFLRSTGMEDIVVPMIDFEKREQEWKKIIRTSGDDWHKNLETITKWSPYSSEEELLLQFQSLDKQGTRIIIYNLWEDEEGHLELDFDEDIHDIQIRGVNRDNNKILLAQQFPNAKHFLTYRHSLRSYAGILYLRLPPGYRIILRGKDVVHHNLINDMTHSMEHIYRPQLVGDDGARSSVDMVAVVTLGFVKDAEAHINIQGFSVYHKNRLIKPFWRVWNAAGSDGRGVIGVLEANFIEPAHDKQGFERTIVLSRLETRLIKLQKDFWRDNCHKVGYAPRRQLKNITPAAREPTLANKSRPTKTGNENIPHENGHALRNRTPGAKSASYFENDSSSRDNSSENDPTNKHQESPLQSTPCVKNTRETSSSSYPDTSIFVLRKENADLKERLLGVGGSKMADFQRALEIEKEQCKSLEAQILKAQKKIEELGNEQEALVRIFTEERNQRDVEEEKLRKRLQAASTTIKELEEKVKLLERKRVPSSKKK